MTFGPSNGGLLPFRIDGGRAWHLDIPADGRRLLTHAAIGDYTELVPALVVEQSFLTELADDTSSLDLDDCRTIAVELAEDIYGVPWWTAGRLAATALEHWDQYGAYTVTVAHDATAALPAHRHIAAMLAWLRTAVSADEKRARRLELDLFNPPPELATRKRLLAARKRQTNGDAKGFLQQVAGLGGGG
ncbi:hypothetical protein DY218_27275 [Streptomyces triticagri]|uniref:Uncharacterized protein n=1 Tax=Streptomyces triticagri TaxID=2293568 RepID=A0A372LY75_9ACTN|nr:hypothetical protein [Streptomyces triticagri]RFU83612.1 hypothetical protein DY218_27275 [Streptomyces triticagri]